MAYLPYTCLCVFAFVIIRVFSQNSHAVSWHEDATTIFNCSCAFNTANMSHVYSMNISNKHIEILPITSNGTISCSQSKCIDCKWEIHVDYNSTFDAIEIGSNRMFPSNCVDENCAQFILMITNCQGDLVLNYSFSTENKNPTDISMATREKCLYVYFNSSQSGSACDYDDNPLTLEFYYASVNDCGCWQSNELHLDAINNTYALYYPTHDILCLNVPCINCTWRINISYADSNDFVSIQYEQDFQLCNSRLVITNCKNNVPIIDSSTARIDMNDIEFALSGYLINLNIQENELCIDLNHTGSEDVCNYVPTNGNFCWFGLILEYQHYNGLTIKDLSMNDELPILVLPDELKCSSYLGETNGFRLIPNFGVLQLWIGNNLPDNASEIIYVFDSQNLSNLISAYDYMDKFISLNSSTGTFSIFPSFHGYSEIDWLSWFYYAFRIEESRFSNCNDTNFVNFAPFEHTFMLNASANTLSNCLTSILIPSASPSYLLPSLPILYISFINYTGSSSVKALSTIYNKSYELFEFSEEDSKYWGNSLLYGNLINFVIPPNGTLKIKYKALESTMNITENDFQDYGYGIVQSSNYPINTSIQTTPQIITKCTKGVAKITIKIIHVEIPAGGYLIINGQNQHQVGIITNETIVFNSDTINLYYYLGANQNSTGLLLHYEGQYINIKEEKQIWQKAWFWILVGIVILLLVAAVILGIYFYLRKYKKKTTERFEFMIDIIKKQYQLTTEDADELKEVSDALFISKDKLIFNYENTLGSGICSTVYRGFLSGPSPLINLTGLIETHDFQDCDVAVKVALHFGDDEVDQLFREIEAMKVLRYNRNVISMLGWRMLNGKPALVFELAEQDLLRYAKMLMSIDTKEIEFKTIISILWQIAKGMEFIASKDIVHRDLAARNILLTNDLQAKISDFGLAIINNSGIKESSVPKKLPVRWLSIEAIVEKLFSEKSDVWAFGVLMYEVFIMGQDPYAGIPTEMILRFLRSGERMSRPRLATNEIYELMCRCWEENMETRPKFEELVLILHNLLEDEAGCSKYYNELEFLLENEERRVSLNDNNSIALEILDNDL